MASNGRWEDPCGIREGGDEIDYEVSDDLLEESFEKATRSAKVAHRHIIEHNRIPNEKYNFYDMESIENYSLDFLIVPELTENVTTEDLLGVFNVLQKFGLSFEVIQEDTKDDTQYYVFWNDLKEVLLQVLCDLDLLLMDLKLTKREKISKIDIAENLNVTSQEKGVRDVIIVRDYEKAVHYVVNILQNLKESTFPIF